MIRTVAPALRYRRTSATPVPLISYLIMYNIYPPSPKDPEPTADVEVETRWTLAGRKRSQNRFLKGPVLLKPLQAAARLPGRTLHLYLAIRHRCDLRRSRTVTLPSAYLRSWGLDKHAKSRALAGLELARLITVDRNRGHTVVVTLL